MKITTLISNLLESNTFILEEKETLLIFDAGAEVEDLKKFLNKEPDAIFITHGHYDHIFNLDEYSKTFSCPIYASKEAIDKFYSTKLNCSENLVIKTSKERFSLIENEEPIEIKGLKITPIFTPGHTNCSISYLVNGELFAGDFLFKTGIGRYDLETSNKQELLKSLEKIKSYNFNNIHSGHGEDSSLTEQERNLAIWTRFLKR